MAAQCSGVAPSSSAPSAAAAPPGAPAGGRASGGRLPATSGRSRKPTSAPSAGSARRALARRRRSASPTASLAAGAPGPALALYRSARRAQGRHSRNSSSQGGRLSSAAAASAAPATACARPACVPPAPAAHSTLHYTGGGAHAAALRPQPRGQVVRRAGHGRERGRQQRVQQRLGQRLHAPVLALHARRQPRVQRGKAAAHRGRPAQRSARRVSCAGGQAGGQAGGAPRAGPHRLSAPSLSAARGAASAVPFSAASAPPATLPACVAIARAPAGIHARAAALRAHAPRHDRAAVRRRRARLAGRGAGNNWGWQAAIAGGRLSSRMASVSRAGACYQAYAESNQAPPLPQARGCAARAAQASARPPQAAAMSHSGGGSAACSCSPVPQLVRGPRHSRSLCECASRHAAWRPAVQPGGHASLAVSAQPSPSPPCASSCTMRPPRSAR